MKPSIYTVRKRRTSGTTKYKRPVLTGAIYFPAGNFGKKFAVIPVRDFTLMKKKLFELSKKLLKINRILNDNRLSN